MWEAHCVNNSEKANKGLNQIVIKFEDAFNQYENGGFDIVIGNPPYIFARNEMFTKEQKEYYYSHYNISDYQLNTYLMFIEKAYNIVNTSGMVGYIIPNNCLTINSFDKFRKFIINNTNYLHIINSLDKVFLGANVDTCILIFSKENIMKTKHVIGELKDNKFNSISGDFFEEFTKTYIINIKQYSVSNKNINYLMEKITNKSLPLNSFAKVGTGLKAYQSGKGNPKQTQAMKENRIFHSMKKEDKTYWKYLQGKDVIRYFLNWSKEYLSYGDWLAEPRKSIKFDKERILIRQTPSKLPYCINAIYTSEAYLNDINSMVVYEFKINPLFLLGIINSKLISFWFANYFGKLDRGIFPQFKVNELGQFPIIKIDLENKKDKEIHDKLVNLVDSIIEINKKLNNEKNPDSATMLRKQVEALDGEVDRLVYGLYGLTEEEIKVVEGID